MTKDNIKARVEQYVQLVSRLNEEYYRANNFTFEQPAVAEVHYGGRYAKIVFTPRGGVHTFIDLRNGDILKAATYKAPAKNGVRGNIFADDLGESVITNHGAKYLR